MNVTRSFFRVATVVAAVAIWIAGAAIPARAGEPCCNIVSINSHAGIATAKVNATGQQFQFRLNNPAQLASLRVGQPVYANLRNRQVSIDGQHPAGQIVSIASSKAAPLDGIKTSAAPLDGIKNPAAPLDGIKTSAAPLDGIITQVNAAQGVVTSTMNNGQTLELHLDNASVLKALAMGHSGGTRTPEPVRVTPCGTAGTFQYDSYDSGYGGAHCPAGYFACQMPLTGQTSGGLKVCGSTYVCMKGDPEQNASDCKQAGGRPVAQ